MTLRRSILRGMWSVSRRFASAMRVRLLTKFRSHSCQLYSMAWATTTSARTGIFLATRPILWGTLTKKQSGWPTCTPNFPLDRQSPMSYRFTTCLDSRKTGHRVRQDVFTKDSQRYGWGLPDCMSHVEKYEWKEGSDVRRNKALGPFVLESLRDFGTDLANTFLSEYEKLGGQAGVGGSTTADNHLLGPHQRIVQKLSEMESLLGGDGNKLILEARRELGMIENHVDKIKSEWSKGFPSSRKKKSGSTQKEGVAELRGRFVSGPDAPHLSLLGDIPAIRASYGYKLCWANKPTFAFSMAFEDICRIKAQELDGTILDRELAELMTIPKTAVRTLSALRALT